MDSEAAASTSTTAPNSSTAVSAPRFSSNAILVNRVQKDNPLTKHFKNVPWRVEDILADFEVGRTTGVLFLSLKYHRLHPEYCYGRIQALEKRYLLRILLILCDVGDQHEQPIRELTKSCLINEITIIVAWSFEEAAMYLQAFKAYENRPPDSIKERVDKDYPSVLRASLTSIKGVNKTDVTTLKTYFGSFSGIAHASTTELSNCPGIGPTKVRRLHDALNQPFRRSSSSTPSQGKGKERERASDLAPPSARLRPPAAPRRVLSEAPEAGPSGRGRSPSPEWDIELDLNDEDEPPRAPQPPPWEDPSPSTGSAPPTSTQETEVGAGRYSPDWDIDLDVDDEIDAPQALPSSQEDAPAKKKRRPNDFTA